MIIIIVVVGTCIIMIIVVLLIIIIVSQFSYCYPYDYSTLTRYLDSIEKKSYDFFKRDILCHTVVSKESPVQTCLARNHLSSKEPLYYIAKVPIRRTSIGMYSCNTCTCIQRGHLFFITTNRGSQLLIETHLCILVIQSSPDYYRLVTISMTS